MHKCTHTGTHNHLLTIIDETQFIHSTFFFSYRLNKLYDRGDREIMLMSFLEVEEKVVLIGLMVLNVVLVYEERG